MAVVSEEREQLQSRVKQMDVKNEQLQESLEKFQQQMGVPEKVFNQAKADY